MKMRLLCLGCALTLCASVHAGVVLVPGSVPDWNQPYAYNAPAGPGPDPRPGLLDPWNAWCAPTAAANLVGHWQDQYGAPVADGLAYPLTPAWPAANWHDYQADGAGARPLKIPFPPGAATDIGWYMDTNFRGTLIGGNVAHAGTYLKDIHAGLGMHLSMMQAGWSTGTQGKMYAGGMAPTGLPAAIHPNAASAWAELTSEINAGRTMIVSWLHWNLVDPNLASITGVDKFYQFGGPSSTDPWGNDEYWDGNASEDGLGHAVTAVGYLDANDPLNPLPGTDWVIVHDNVLQTPTDVAVPFNWNVWVANTNAVPEPGALLLVGMGVMLLLRRR